MKNGITLNLSKWWTKGGERCTISAIDSETKVQVEVGYMNYGSPGTVFERLNYVFKDPLDESIKEIRTKLDNLHIERLNSKARDAAYTAERARVEASAKNLFPD